MKNKPETNGIDHLKRIGENGVELLGPGKTALEIEKMMLLSLLVLCVRIQQTNKLKQIFKEKPRMEYK